MAEKPQIIKRSKSMSNLTKGLITVGSVLGVGSIGYEILGDTVIDEAPTLLKLIKGKDSDKKVENKRGKFYDGNNALVKKTLNDLNKKYLKHDDDHIEQTISDILTKMPKITKGNKKFEALYKACMGFDILSETQAFMLTYCMPCYAFKVKVNENTFEVFYVCIYYDHFEIFKDDKNNKIVTDDFITKYNNKEIKFDKFSFENSK